MALTGDENKYVSAIHKALTTKDAADNVLAKAFSKGQVRQNVDLKRELGLEREEVQRTRRMQAMEKPAQFQAARDEAYDKMNVEIENAYMTSYNQFIQAGFSEDDAKSKGMAVAKSMKNAQEEAIKSEFGSDAVIINAAKRVTQAAADTAGIKF